MAISLFLVFSGQQLHAFLFLYEVQRMRCRNHLMEAPFCFAFFAKYLMGILKLVCLPGHRSRFRLFFRPLYDVSV